MSQAFGWVVDPANIEVANKYLTLLLLIGGAVALWELIRYLRALRKERDLARHLAYLQMRDDGRRSGARSGREAVAPGQHGLLGGLVRGTVQAAGVLLILFVVTAAAAMPFLGGWLAHQDYPDKADYIVALPGDGRGLLKAADLYKQGFASRVLLSTVPQSSTGSPANVDPYELQLRALEKAGVPRGSTASFGTGHATLVDAAEGLKKFVEGRRVKMIVVTAANHALRTKVVLQDILPRARIMVVSPPETKSDQAWWNDQATALSTINEAARLAHYWVASGLRALRTEPEAPAQNASASQPPSPSRESLGVGTSTRTR